MRLKKWEILKDSVPARRHGLALNKEYDLQSINPDLKDVGSFHCRCGSAHNEQLEILNFSMLRKKS
jgi:hypothetical protein